jgi:hypothetical protein
MSDDFAALRIGFSRLSLCGVGAFVTANNQIAKRNKLDFNHDDHNE